MTLFSKFEVLEDPRDIRGKKYKLIDILIMTIYGILCGLTDFTNIADFMKLKEDYFIDLVFYNYLMKCFVLVDLKTGKITHQDVGQMDMYVRMYDELKKSSDDNPTLGVVMCTETDEDIARYSVLHGNEQLFATKYKLYLPSEQELREEIETQKAMFYLQQKERESAE